MSQPTVSPSGLFPVSRDGNAGD